MCIRKTAIATLASENFERKNKSKNVAKLQVNEGTRDLFGRLLYHSATNAMDLESVFSFLFESACFAYPDGNIRQNDKSTVFDHLTKDFSSNPPDTIETTIADGMFILNLSTQSLPKTYSALARRILVKVLNLTNIPADLCFGIYESPSIKDVKRKDRGDIETEREYCIGPRLKIPSNFNELLKISSFKSSFLEFLMKEYENIEYACVMGEKVFYCSIDNICTKFYCVEGSLKFEAIPELFGRSC